MKRIPYRISDYENLIRKNCYYVDKTMYLEKLEDLDDTLVFLRPRRFGKTLFTSMMSYYYDINSKDKFDELFKDTYVYDNPTCNKNNYYAYRERGDDGHRLKTAHGVLREYEGYRQQDKYYRPERADALIRLLVRLEPLI